MDFFGTDDWINKNPPKTDKKVKKGKIMKPISGAEQQNQHKVVEEVVDKKKVKEKDVFGVAPKENLQEKKKKS